VERAVRYNVMIRLMDDKPPEIVSVMPVACLEPIPVADILMLADLLRRLEANSQIIPLPKKALAK